MVDLREPSLSHSPTAVNPRHTLRQNNDITDISPESHHSPNVALKPRTLLSNNIHKIALNDNTNKMGSLIASEAPSTTYRMGDQFPNRYSRGNSKMREILNGSQ
jgi:hypothetical protein